MCVIAYSWSLPPGRPSAVAGNPNRTTEEATTRWRPRRNQYRPGLGRLRVWEAPGVTQRARRRRERRGASIIRALRLCVSVTSAFCQCWRCGQCEARSRSGRRRKWGRTRGMAIQSKIENRQSPMDVLLLDILSKRGFAERIDFPFRSRGLLCE